MTTIGYAKDAAKRDMLGATTDAILENVQLAIAAGELERAERLTRIYVMIEQQGHCCQPPVDFQEDFEN